MGNTSRSYTPQKLALIILITKGSPALCLWQSWALMQNLFADLGSQGRISDGGVLRNTVFYHALDAKQLNIPEPKALTVNDTIVEE